MPERSAAIGLDEPEEQRWLVCVHEVAGCPAILRLLADVPPDIAAEDHADRIAIAWRYDPEPDGLPSESDGERMDFVEDLIAEVVERRMNACLAIVATANGFREWTLYAHDGGIVAEYVAQLARDNALPVEVRCDPDPDWDAYHRLLAATDEESAELSPAVC